MATGYEITMKLCDVTAAEDSSPTGTALHVDSNLSAIFTEENKPTKYATLEPNYTLLDGTFLPFPDDIQTVKLGGIWSAFPSGPDCTFKTPPSIEIAFEQPHSSVGLTLIFDTFEGTYASEVEVNWYSQNNSCLRARKFQLFKVNSFLEEKVEGFHKVTLSFLKMSKPQRFLKLSQIEYGVTIALAEEDVISGKVLEEIALDFSEVSANSLDFTFHSTKYKPLDTKSSFSALQQGQKVLCNGHNGELDIPLGTFYLKSWSTDEKNNITMHCEDALWLLDSVPFNGGLYSGEPLRNVLATVFSAAGVPYSIDESIGNNLINGHLPMCSAREALAQLALVNGAVVDTSRSGVINIYPLPERPTSLIDNNRKFVGEKVSRNKQISGLDVIVHSFSISQEPKEIFTDKMVEGEYIIAFDEPLHSLNITGGIISESNVNYAKVVVSQSGEITLTGKKYLHSFRKAAQSKAQNIGTGTKDRLQLSDVEIVTSQNVGEVSETLLEFYNSEFITQFPVVLQEEKPGDILMVRSSSGSYLKGRVSSCSIDLTKGLMTVITLAGTPIPLLTTVVCGEAICGVGGII